MSDQDHEADGPARPAVPSSASDILASDAEREAVVARLNAACGEGRLTLEEFSERLERSYTARTRGELQPLLRDLPAESSEPASAPVRAGEQGERRGEWHVTPIGGISRRGPWRMRDLTAITLIGGADLDLREAQFTAREVTLTKVSLVGGVNLTVPPGVQVVIEGFSILGGRRVEIDEVPDGDAPTLRVRAFSLIGGINVRSSRPVERLRAAREARRAGLDGARAERRAAFEEARDQRRAGLDDARAARRAARDERRRGRRHG
ncbi:DUF1707 SHOCT-like domain-containing protein [Actinopolymorpha pittospori]